MTRREKTQRRRRRARERDDYRRIAEKAERYVVEIFCPNIKEPRSIDRRRDELVHAVEVWRTRRGLSSLRRAA